MNVYIVAGADINSRLSVVFTGNGYTAAGFSCTLEQALVEISREDLRPDLIVVCGLPLASGLTEGVVNRSMSMLLRLRDLRMASPRSRIILVLPSGISRKVIVRAVMLGIYDVYAVSEFNDEQLIGWIRTPKSIADYKGLSVGSVPEPESLDVHYGEAEKKNSGKRSVRDFIVLAGFNNAGRGKNNREKNGQSEDAVNVCEKEDQTGNQNAERKGMGLASIFKKVRCKKTSPGLLRLVLGLGNKEMEDWIEDNLSGQLEVVYKGAEPEGLREAIGEMSPDVLILMRHGIAGGIPGAVDLVEQCAGLGPKVVFIAGEMDEEGLLLAERAKSAGVKHVLSCPAGPGSFISGEELVYTVRMIAREMVKTNCVNSAKNESKRTLKKKPQKITGFHDEGVSLHGYDPVQGRAEDHDSTAIHRGGLFAVVSPWRPGLAGRLAAQAVKILSGVNDKVVYVGASKTSTGAIWLDVPDEELIMSDWRVPGSQAPLRFGSMDVYAVDPAKDLEIKDIHELWDLVRNARRDAVYTVVDCGDRMDIAQEAAFIGRSVLLVILPGDDPVEMKTSQTWLRNLSTGRQNIVVGIDLRGAAPVLPGGLEPSVIVRDNPADALCIALKKGVKGEYNWR